MIYLGKFKIIDNLITACDYDFILKKIEEAIKGNKSLLISPITSHTLVKAHYDKSLRKVLDSFDYLVPDSQWVKRSIWFLYGKRLKERVYGPDLMLKTCQLTEKKGFRIFLYGNKKTVLIKLIQKLKEKFPLLKIAGKEESKFRELTEGEMRQLGKSIEKNKGEIIFICLGSPKQEIFSYNLKKYLNTPKILIPVGAAFDFISGNKSQAPKWIQRWGLEWAWRLIQEPRRLGKRYIVDGIQFLLLCIKKGFLN